MLFRLWSLVFCASIYVSTKPSVLNPIRHKTVINPRTLGDTRVNTLVLRAVKVAHKLAQPTSILDGFGFVPKLCGRRFLQKLSFRVSWALI